MSYEKTIVCLANSRKQYPNRCVAGKEFRRGNFGAWVRPISDQAKGDLTLNHRRYDDGADPDLLDVVKISFEEARPQGCQKENHRIDAAMRWVKKGQIDWEQLAGAVDHIDGALWTNGYSGSNGENDRIPEETAKGLQSSLLLVEPEQLKISVAMEGGYDKPAYKKVRAHFRLNGLYYLLAVTDPPVEDKYRLKEVGEYAIKTPTRLCISIGEAYKGFCYKLVAGLITPDRARK
jgi:putative nucleic acid modification protein with dual OB domain